MHSSVALSRFFRTFINRMNHNYSLELIQWNQQLYNTTISPHFSASMFSSINTIKVSVITGRNFA
jgi:hypothetical protein